MAEILELGIPRLYPDCEIHVDPAEQLGDVEAYVANHPPRLVLSDHSYARAWDDDTRMRFTLAHEYGHLKLHLHYLSSPDGKAPRGKHQALIPRYERASGKSLCSSFSPAGVASPEVSGPRRPRERQWGQQGRSKTPASGAWALS